MNFPGQYHPLPEYSVFLPGMSVRFIKPSPALSPYIERYWCWDHENENGVHFSAVPPGIGLDLYLHYREPFHLDQKGKLPGSHLIYSWENPSILLPADRPGFIAIRFRAGMFKNFTDIPLVELTDQYPDAESIWGKEGKAMLQRINGLGDFPTKIPLLEEYLTGLLAKYKKDTPLWNTVIQDLYTHQDTLRLDTLSERLRISYRHFRRKFIEETGMPPKHFQQLARFHSTVKPLLLNREKRYLSIALDKGYFDQTHFIKEFKYFMHTTPSDFLQEKNFMSHFYYSRL